jgi:hypothetical protein
MVTTLACPGRWARPALLALLLLLSLLTLPPASPAQAAVRQAPASDEPLATVETTGWATVIRAMGPEILQVEGANGAQVIVWHVGIIGPAADQGIWRQQGTAVHAQHLPAGTRVWLERLDGPSALRPGWTLRHVFRDSQPEQPTAADLLRAGSVWVYPHVIHDFVDSFADRQAEAVLTRAGAWAETNSSAIFRPRDVEHGGYPINPAVLPALEALDASEIGHALLIEVNRFPVEIAIGPVPPGAAASFKARYYSIQLNQLVMSATPESVAAVLIHELVHANQMVEGSLSGQEIDCYEGEVEAFEATAQYWQAVHGPDGKRLPEHLLDHELNVTVRQVENQVIRERVRGSYGHQCGAPPDLT